MPTDELRHFEADLLATLKGNVDRISLDISELKLEVRTMYALRDTNEALVKEMTALREREIAELKALILELKDKIIALNSLLPAKSDPVHLG